MLLVVERVTRREMTGIVLMGRCSSKSVDERKELSSSELPGKERIVAAVLGCESDVKGICIRSLAYHMMLSNDIDKYPEYPNLKF